MLLGRGFVTNNAPSITVPGAQSAVSNIAKAITGTSIADTDGNTQTVTLSVSHGTFTLAVTTGLSFSVGDGTDDAAMTFSGSLANINTALATITYTSTTDYVGADSLSITTNDGTVSVGPSTVAITVASPIVGLFTYYWSLSEASGVAASSATSADLTATNSPVAGTGKVGNGRAFVAASSQQLTRNMILGVSYNTDWSLCFWVKPVGVSGFQFMTQKNAPGAAFRVFASGSTYTQDWSGGPGYTSGSAFFAADTWCQVTLTYQGTGDKKLRTYKNGTLVDTSTANAGTQVDSDAGQTLFFGGVGANYLDGIMDEIGFAAATCFDANQVSAYYSATNAGRGYPNF